MIRKQITEYPKYKGRLIYAYYKSGHAYQIMQDDNYIYAWKDNILISTSRIK